MTEILYLMFVRTFFGFLLISVASALVTFITRKDKKLFNSVISSFVIGIGIEIYNFVNYGPESIAPDLFLGILDWFFTSMIALGFIMFFKFIGEIGIFKEV